MRTEDLIEVLSANVPRLPRRAGPHRVLKGVGGGAVVSLAFVVFAYGVRPDFIQASATFAFWMKWAFTLGVAAAAFDVVRRLARPEGRVGAAWLAVAIPIVLVAGLGALELAAAPSSARPALWLGHTAARCSSAIVLLAVPIQFGLFWSFRRLAPTRPASAGAAAGLLAGATAAAVYALSCPEQTAIFMATWYSGGIAISGLLGSLLGLRALRW